MIHQLHRQRQILGTSRIFSLNVFIKVNLYFLAIFKENISVRDVSRIAQIHFIHVSCHISRQNASVSVGVDTPDRNRN